MNRGLGRGRLACTEWVRLIISQESASRTLMLGVLWPVVHITQHPDPICPAVVPTSFNSRLGGVCQSQLWPMGISHTLSHSINSNRYLTQMCHAYPDMAYPDIAFTLNWHNSRGNIMIDWPVPVKQHQRKSYLLVLKNKLSMWVIMPTCIKLVWT